MIHRERIEWSDVWVEQGGETGAPRVLMVGDSIARSYYPCAKELIGDGYACARLATSKCVCDPLFMKELGLVLDEYQFAAIHFNNGLHGWDYDENCYGDGLKRALEYIRASCSQTALIWATTTPVWEKDGTGRLSPRTDRVRERNRLAAAYAAEFELPISDLFGAVIDRPEYVSNDGVHFNDEGKRFLGNVVAEAIQNVL